MDAKEKAKELVEKMYNPGFDADNNVLGTLTHKQAKQCALIAVDEIIESYRLNVSLGWTGAIHENNIEYYQKVKEEINQQ